MNNTEKKLTAEKVVELHVKERIPNLQSINQSIEMINKLKTKMMATTSSIKHMKGLKHHIGGVALQGHHTVIFGPSGSFKTTFITALCFQALKENPELEVHYWAFDVSPPYIQATVKLINELGMKKKLLLFSDVTILDMTNFYKEHIKTNVRLENTIIVLDTFKFLSDNVNDKNSNKDAMHFIKKICKLGAAWVSIAHTNKDVQKQSGTAEIEQDSDGLLRIDSVISDGKGIANIKKGGRCRWGDTSLTIETTLTAEDRNNPSLFLYYAIKDARLIEYVDIEKLKAIQVQAKDMVVIAEIIKEYYTKNNQFINKTDLTTFIKANEMLELSQSEIKKILVDGEGKYWKTERNKSENNKLSFMPIS